VADELRGVAEGLLWAHDGCAELAYIGTGDSWSGDGYAAFCDARDRSPTADDVSNAQWVMGRAAWACDVLASGIQDCQERIDYNRDRIDSLCIGPDGDITDDQLPITQAVQTDVSAVWDDYWKHIQGFEQIFGELVELTVHAQAAPGFWDRLGEGVSWAGDNIAENWNGLFDEGGIFNRLGDLDFSSPRDLGQFWLEEFGNFYGGMWEGVTEMWDGAVAMAWVMAPGWNPAKAEWINNLNAAYDAYQHDPRQFQWDTGEAVLDYDTFRESPARWSGKLLPTLALSAIPVAGPTTAITTRTTALTTRLTRLATTLRQTPTAEHLPTAQRPPNPVRPIPQPIGGPGAASGPSPGSLVQIALDKWRKNPYELVKVNNYLDVRELLQHRGAGSRGFVTLHYGRDIEQIEVIYISNTIYYRYVGNEDHFRVLDGYMRYRSDYHSFLPSIPIQ
jgi:hypothetical protein